MGTHVTPRELQQLLAQGGLAPGPIDGIWGSQTRRACEAWFASGRDLGDPSRCSPALPVETLLVPPEWMPMVPMERVVTHWTAGAYSVSALDREHYHIVVSGNGTLVRGDHSVADNVSTGDGDYAAHTRGCNTGSIGVAVACMAGAVERPLDAGRFPMTELQWSTMARVVAELCHRYSILVTPRTVLGHGEVQSVLGITQAGKWDPMVLPWQPTLTVSQVGTKFREEVLRHLV